MPVVYVITYDKNGADSGSTPVKQEKQARQDLSIADNSGALKRTGYEFMGWNEKADGKGTSYQTGSRYTEDKAITLYAEWWALIQYDANGADSGSAPVKQKKQPGKDLTIIGDTAGNLVKQGEYFAGWNTNANGNGQHYKAGSSYTIDKPLTLYAEWDSFITLNYDANGADSGSTPVKQEKKPGEDFIISDNSGSLKRTGYIFKGWNTQADGTGTSYQAGASYTEDKTLSLYAEWWALIQYDANGADSGSTPVKQEKQSGHDYSIADNSGSLKRTGYMFKGWNTQADGTGTSYQVGASYTEDKGLSLYAEWWALIQYDANGADSGSTPAKQEKQPRHDYSIADNSGSLKRTGYIFKGWNTQADGIGTSYQAGASYTEDKELSLYAEWWALIQYDANGADSGSTPVKQEKQPGHDYSIADNSGSLKRTGYIFKRWNTQADGTGTSYQAGASYTEDKELSLYAEWWALIQYDANGADSGSAPVKQEKQSGHDYSIADNSGSLKRTGYIFKRWNTQADGTGTWYQAGTSYTEDKGLSLYAEWWALIQYDANGANSGSAPVKQEKQPGKDVIIADNTGILKKGRLHFAGWNTKADGQGTYYNTGLSYTKDKGLILYAQWTRVIPITRVSDFQKMRTQLSGSFVLLKDLDLPDTFKSIGTKNTPFTGNFYGKGHILSNLRLIDPNSESLGFFSSLKDAYIFWLTFNNPKVEGKSSVGVLAGFISGKTKVDKVIIKGRNAQVKITENNVGMLVGRVLGDNSNYILIENCEVAGRVMGNNSVGGMIGIAKSSKVKYCKATAGVNGTGKYIGGLLGRQEDGYIIKSYAIGEVKGTGSQSETIGGLVGWLLANSHISNSYAVGKVSGSGSRSGAIGGLVGAQRPTSDIINSYATGEVRGTGNFIGGLVGAQNSSAIINNSYATGKVSGIGSQSSGIGGLVGLQYGTIANTYAIGRVSGRSNLGGLVGLQGSVAGGGTYRGKIEQSYFDRRSTGQTRGIGKVVAGVGIPTGYSTSDLTGVERFSGWDFRGVNGNPAIWHWRGSSRWPVLW
ncbi:hypothetical protein LSH36_793g00000 [Paralvinella palmiformis]|uniref:GLUG domain-containing protein n=1 Tax=Paralvinella palmiformis TaxID=53620 RepID=A0AAD9IZR6_9ANNE|nr:hypothetical protein LSH36_793g00000 [Paralvinella palmiformis]